MTHFAIDRVVETKALMFLLRKYLIETTSIDRWPLANCIHSPNSMISTAEEEKTTQIFL